MKPERYSVATEDHSETCEWRTTGDCACSWDWAWTDFSTLREALARAKRERGIVYRRYNFVDVTPAEDLPFLRGMLWEYDDRPVWPYRELAEAPTRR